MADTESKTKNDPTEETDRKPDIRRQQRPNTIVNHEAEKNCLTFQSKNGLRLSLTIHTADIIQLKYVAQGDQPTDFSYAIDPDFNPDTPEVSFEETDTHYAITTDILTCLISKENMQVQFMDSDDNILCRDAKPFLRHHSLMKGIFEVKITHSAPDDMHYFGLGDKVCEEGLRGASFENWNTDAYAYERGDDPLYRSIPFYSALHNGRAYGIFLDSPYRSTFDFDSDETNTTGFAAKGGCMNYYFINGPELTNVSRRYAALTGTPELPPLWGLGYHQCRWSYYPDERVRKLARTFREKEIPCDAIYLDIDYMDDYRVFTWNKERFPDPKKLISDLNKHGFETIVMIDPGIKVDPDYEIYQQGLENDYFCKRPDGELMIGPVWPPETVFPDYTNPQVRQWWGDLYEDLLAEKNVSGVWNDMNEPAVFEVEKKTFPDDIRHNFDGHSASHKKAHNIYGMQMARASFDGIKKHNDDKRPFLLTRANFAGGQRYAALWTGDNIANWDHLRLANEQCQRLSISGFSFVGTDIGGFVKNPSGELFTRWLQLSVFHPLFRNHSMGYNVDGAAAVKKDEVEQKKLESDSYQEPWSFGKKYTDINRSVIELRYRLLHYLYSAFHQHVQEGTPILRPLAYYDQSDERAVKEIDEFLFGDHILVSPVLDNKKRTVETYFPAGRWYDYRTNKVFEGADTYPVDAPLAEIPFFIKGGTVLPLREVMQYSAERDSELLELNLYYDERSVTSTLYEDAHEGYHYIDGEYRHTTFRWQPDPNNNTATLIAERSGSFEPAYDTVAINIIGLPSQPSSIAIDGMECDFEVKSTENGPVCTVQTHPDFEELTLS